MIDESAALLPLWILISAAFGFLIGEAVGGQARVRKYLEKANDDLRQQLRSARPDASHLQQELARQRRVINDIHKRVAAVTKGFPKNHLVNPTISTAGSQRSGRVKRCRLGNG